MSPSDSLSGLMVSRYSSLVRSDLPLSGGQPVIQRVADVTAGYENVSRSL
jgi:hypothetical protein